MAVRGDCPSCGRRHHRRRYNPPRFDCGPSFPTEKNYARRRVWRDRLRPQPPGAWATAGTVCVPDETRAARNSIAHQARFDPFEPRLHNSTGAREGHKWLGRHQLSNVGNHARTLPPMLAREQAGVSYTPGLSRTPCRLRRRRRSLHSRHENRRCPEGD